MSRSDAYIVVTCDRCGTYDEELQLCALGRGGYDLRHIDHELTQLGWCVDTSGEGDICPNCVEDEAADKP